MVSVYNSSKGKWEELTTPKRYADGAWSIVDGFVQSGGTWKHAWYIVESLSVPTLSGTYTYNTNEQTVTISSYDTNAISVSGNKATNAGTYTVTFSLKNKRKYKWSDGSTTDKTATWTIAKKPLTTPTVSGSYTYTRTSSTKATTYSASISYYDSTTMTQSGTTSESNAGTYTVTHALKDKNNYEWSDGTTTYKSGTWSIAKRSLTIPTLSGSYTYTGSSQNVTARNYNSNYEEYTGDASGTNADIYLVVFWLRDTNNTYWSDGTTTQKPKQWKIEKYPFNFKMSSVNISVGTYRNMVSDKLLIRVTPSSSNTLAGSIMPDYPTMAAPGVTVALDVKSNCDIIYIQNSDTSFTFSLQNCGSYGYLEVTFTQKGDSNYASGTQNWAIEW